VVSKLKFKRVKRKGMLGRVGTTLICLEGMERKGRILNGSVGIGLWRWKLWRRRRGMLMIYGVM